MKSRSREEDVGALGEAPLDTISKRKREDGEKIEGEREGERESATISMCVYRTL